jgi:hypothetical protein
VWPSEGLLVSCLWRYDLGPGQSELRKSFKIRFLKADEARENVVLIWLMFTLLLTAEDDLLPGHTK